MTPLLQQWLAKNAVYSSARLAPEIIPVELRARIRLGDEALVLVSQYKDEHAPHYVLAEMRAQGVARPLLRVRLWPNPRDFSVGLFWKGWCFNYPKSSLLRWKPALTF